MKLIFVPKYVESKKSKSCEKCVESFVFARTSKAEVDAKVSEMPIRAKQQKISKAQTHPPPFRGIFPKTNQQIGVFTNAM